MSRRSSSRRVAMSARSDGSRGAKGSGSAPAMSSWRSHRSFASSSIQRTRTGSRRNQEKSNDSTCAASWGWRARNWVWSSICCSPGTGQRSPCRRSRSPIDMPARRSWRPRIVWVVRLDRTVTGAPAPSSTMGTLPTAGRPSTSTVASTPTGVLETTVRARSAQVGANIKVLIGRVRAALEPLSSPS